MALVALSSAACASRVARPGEQRAWVNGFAFGIIAGHDVDVRDVCGSGGADELKTEHSFATVALTLLSLGIYSPRQVAVHCRERR